MPDLEIIELLSCQLWDSRPQDNMDWERVLSFIGPPASSQPAGKWISYESKISSVIRPNNFRLYSLILRHLHLHTQQIACWSHAQSTDHHAPLSHRYTSTQQAALSDFSP